MVVVPDNKTTRQTTPRQSQTFPNVSQPIPNDSRSKTSDSIRFQRFKTQGQRFYTIRYDSRPKASDSIASNDSIRFKSHAQTTLYNPNTGDIPTPTNLMLVGVRRSTKSFPWCKLGSLVGGNSVLDPRNTSNYLYNNRYDYDNERIK
jgi:hypothetical protein